ncbi:MAG TPA: phage tail sheath subtilisin-like domain-containing protein, partial [Candidatus Manganitrophaceae bacterium]|nr:phage tail sheath subtilisin-like domain-containing protein [Candidatus Manganitrophaceae bacterium]
MPTYKSPDVYVEEISVFPPSVAEVETAIPAFIGYSQTARKTADNDLLLKPTKIYSLKEFEVYYGLPKNEAIAVTVSDDGAGGFKVDAFTVNTVSGDPLPSYLLYYSVKMFFDNGGGQCYIVSVGNYAASIDLGAGAGTGLQDGLDAVALEDEPTLIVIPEAVKLSAADYQTLVQAVLDQCNRLKDRFGIFDLRDGGTDLDAAALSANRGYFGNNYLKYGAVYYPFVKTAMNYPVADDESSVSVTYGATTAALSAFSATGASPNTAIHNFVKSALKDHFVKVPPSGAVTGVYAATDTNRGVWKAPANVSLADVLEPLVKLDNAHQDGLNVDATTGKSINAIRAFAGKGTLVWGARTLAGNDNEWR